MESISTQYSGRSGRQIVVTEEGVEDELQVRREGWKVVVTVNAADNSNFHWIITLLLAVFFDYLFSCHFFAPGLSVSLYFCHANAKL